MARTKPTAPVATLKPRKKLSLEKKTVRDLDTRGAAQRVKGGLRITSL